MNEINSHNLKHTSARWFDSDDPANRRIGISLHKGELTIITRENPSDVWSPPKKMYLSASVDTE